MADWTEERDARLVASLAALEGMPDGDWFTDDLDLRDLRAALVAERAEVAKLRAVIAEPTGEEADRLGRVYTRAFDDAFEGERSVACRAAGIRAILADQRRRAG